MSQGATSFAAKISSKSAIGNKAAWTDVEVRPMGYQDIPQLLDFIYRSPRNIPFLQSIDYASWPVEAAYRQFLSDAVQNPHKMPAVAVEYKGRTVGVHTFTVGPDSSADLSAYFWQSVDRGQGIGTISWFKAAQYFFRNFTFDTLYLRVPKDNPVAVAFARKLPFNLVGEEDLQIAGLKSGQRARVYSLSRSEFENLNSTDETTEDLDEESDL